MDDNTPLMEAGIDSLSAVEFRNKARSLADATRISGAPWKVRETGHFHVLKNMFICPCWF